MSNPAVLDSSALLSEEEGCDVVRQYLSGAVMSSVNFSEVVSILLKLGVSKSKAELIIDKCVKTVVPFERKQALLAAEFREKTKKNGLSLGDRACLVGEDFTLACGHGR